MPSAHHFNFICSLETSGDCPIRNGVISATILACDHNLKVIDGFSSNVRPPDLKPFTWSVARQNIHGKSIAEVMGYMPNDQFCYNLLCWLAKFKDPANRPMPFICHSDESIDWFNYFFLEWCFRKAKFANGISIMLGVNVFRQMNFKFLHERQNKYKWGNCKQQ